MEEMIKTLLEQSPWLMVLFLATVNERLIETLVKPFFERYKVDTFWLMPVSWVVGLGLGLLSELNLFPGVFRWDLVGWVLTAVFIGAGSNLVHEAYSIASGLKEVLRARS